MQPCEHGFFLCTDYHDCANCTIDYVLDVYTPHYGTDAAVSVLAGYDIRHAAIGPGTSNSHGYERTHMDGLEATYDLLMCIIGAGN